MRREHKSSLATQAAPSDAPTDPTTGTGVPPLSFAGTGKGYGTVPAMGVGHHLHAGVHPGYSTGTGSLYAKHSDVRLKAMLSARLQQYLVEWLLAQETRILVKQIRGHLEPSATQQDTHMDGSMPADAVLRGASALDAAPAHLEFTDVTAVGGGQYRDVDSHQDADPNVASSIRASSKPEVLSCLLTTASTLGADSVEGTALLRPEDESGSDDEAGSWSGSGELLLDFALPEFHVAEKRPCAVLDAATEATIDKCFAAHPMGMKIAEFETAVVVDLLGLSMYFSQVLFSRIDTEEAGVITKAVFREFWRNRFILGDATNNFFYAVKEDVNDFIWPANFEALIYDILERHPGMEFLKSAPDFQKRYVDTVIGRIYYTLDTHSSGRIQLRALRNSNLVDTWKRIDSETDLNNVRDYFCYEHFYVIYCKFWELDSDHDFHLDKQDLLKYDQHAFSHRAVDRIVAVASDKFTSGSPDHLSYEDFIHFLINDEDKTTDRSLEFWFRVVDIDGDGVIRDHEMAYFYEQQCERLESLCQEVVPFEDVVCQMNDLLNPKRAGQYRISDFKRNRKTAGLFFNLLISLTKFIMHEQRDPFQQKQDLTDYPEWSHSEWDRFCRREYSRLAMDEDCDDDDDWEEMQSESGHSGDQEDRLNDISAPVTSSEQQ